MQCSCGAPAVLPHMNCANVDCNALFLTCDACRVRCDLSAPFHCLRLNLSAPVHHTPPQMRYAGCCCEACMDAPRLLRPAKHEGGHFGKWTEVRDAVNIMVNNIECVPTRIPSMHSMWTKWRSRISTWRLGAPPGGWSGGGGGPSGSVPRRQRCGRSGPHANSWPR